MQEFFYKIEIILDIFFQLLICIYVAPQVSYEMLVFSLVDALGEGIVVFDGREVVG